MSLTLAPPPTSTWRGSPVNAARRSHHTTSQQAPLPPPPTLAEMAALGEPVRIKMSWDQWWDYPYEGNAEYANGEAILMPPPSRRHARIQGRLIRAEVSDPARLEASPQFGVGVDKKRCRIPDVVFTPPDSLGGERLGAVLVAVEVLSTGSRRNDFIDKQAEYFASGVGQYWVVDLVANTIEVFENDDDERWLKIAIVDAEHPEAVIQVPGHGTITLLHGEIFQ